jgi:aspartate/methionine/tyrosine aminotransferase
MSQKLLKIGGGEPAFKTPPHIIDAMKKALDDDFTHYGNPEGLPEFRNAIINRYSKRYGTQFNPDNVTLTPGSSMGIFMVAKALCGPGDQIATMNPCFFGYLSPFKEIGVNPTWIPRNESEDWSIHASDIEKALTPRTKAILLCNPDNPTGAILKKSDLKSIAEIAEKHDLYIITDDIYDEIVYDNVKIEHITTLPNMKERTIVLNGVSKAYAMTGWRMGYIIAPNEKIQRALTDIQQATYFVTNPAIQIACTAALTGPQDCVKSMLNEYDKKRRMVYDLYNDMRGVTVTKPLGAFYFFPNFSSYKIKSTELTQKLREAGVSVTPGAMFGSNGEYHFRTAYCQSDEDLTQGLAIIKKTLQDMKP